MGVSLGLFMIFAFEWIVGFFVYMQKKITDINIRSGGGFCFLKYLRLSSCLISCHPVQMVTMLFFVGWLSLSDIVILFQLLHRHRKTKSTV